MVTVPAFVWRGGRVRRALTVGFGVAVPLAALAWLDSGMWLSAVLVSIILAISYGIWMTRRMARYWPGAEKLSGEERVTVVRAARHGERLETRGSPSPSSITPAGCMQPRRTLDPSDGWCRSFSSSVSRRRRGTRCSVTWGDAIASAIYLVLLLLELFGRRKGGSSCWPMPTTPRRWPARELNKSQSLGQLHQIDGPPGPVVAVRVRAAGRYRDG